MKSELKLYEMTRQYEELMSFDGSSEEWEQALMKLEGQIQVKVGNICKLLTNLESEQIALENEEKRLARRRKVRKHQIESLKGYMLREMISQERFLENAVETGFHRVSVCESPRAAEIFDEEKIPAQYVQIETHIKLAEVREKLLNGEEVPGARLGEQKYYLRIK